MKNRVQVITVLALLVFSMSAFADVINRQTDGPKIIGTWVSEDDPKSKWVFSGTDLCRRYYDGRLVGSYTFKVSGRSPQCGTDVKIGPNQSYLSLKKTDDHKERCYFVNGLTDNTLSLSPFNKGSLMIFKKE